MAVKTSIGKEFLEVAIQIERNGRGFYEFMTQQSKEKQIRDIFARLAAREKEHENTFSDMLKRLGGYQPVRVYGDEEYRYIKELASISIFAGEKAEEVKKKKTMTDIEAVEIGMGFEKDSILFYSEVRGMLPQPDQDIIDMITSEEKKHLSELSYLANKLRGRTA